MAPTKPKPTGVNLSEVVHHVFIFQRDRVMSVRPPLRKPLEDPLEEGN